MGMESKNPYEGPNGARPRDCHRPIRVLGMWLIMAGVSLFACSLAIVMLTSVMLAPGVGLQRARVFSIEYGVLIGGVAIIVGLGFWLNGRKPTASSTMDILRPENPNDEG